MTNLLFSKSPLLSHVLYKKSELTFVFNIFALGGPDPNENTASLA